MANWQELEIRDFGQGLITNASAVDQAKTSFREFTNLEEISPGLCTPLPGSGTAQIRVQGTLTNIPALPSGFTLEKGFIWHATTPGTGSDYVVIFGSKSSRDRFYVWPDITSAGAWSTTTGTRVSGSYINWLELTEVELITVSNVDTPDTVCTYTGLSNGSSSGYYDRWYLWNNNRSLYDYVIGSCGSSSTASNQLKVKWGVTGVTSGDVVILMRFPIFKKAATVTPYYSIDDLPEFYPHGDSLVVHTGVHAINSGTDLKLGYVGQDTTAQGFFDDNDLDYNGWHFDAAHPFPTDRSGFAISTIVAAASTDDPIPWTTGTDYYLTHATAVYGNSNESRIYFDPTGGGSNLFTSVSAVDKHLSLAYSVDITTKLARQSDYAASSGSPTLWSRFITKIRQYVSRAELLVSAGSFARPSTDWFLVKEIDIDDAAWSLGGTSYQLSTTIKGTEWLAGQKYPFSLVNGYEISKVGANAKFEVSVAGRNFIAPIYDDTKKLFRSLFSPIRLSGENAPDIYPVISRIDTLHYGIYEITGICEQYGRLLVFGRDQLVVASVSGENRGEIDEAYQKVGCIAYRTIKNLEGMVFFLSERRVEIFDGNKVIDSPFERIRDIFDDATLAQKEAAFAGIHRNRREYWVAITVSGAQRIFIYSLIYNSIKEYDSSSTYIDFIEGANGELFGLTSSTIVELASGTPTESLVISLKSQVYNHQLSSYRRARIAYKSASAMTFYHLDETLPSGMQELDGKLLLAQTELDEVDIPLGMRTGRSAFRLARSASTDTTLQIDSIVLARTPQENR